VEIIKASIGIAAIVIAMMFFLMFIFCWLVYLPLMGLLDKWCPKARARIELFLITGV